MVSTTNAHNSFGEVSSSTASVNAAVLYDASFVRDGIGRIVQRTEIIGGVTDTFDYGYGATGEIIAVARNGTTVESYGYDANGNRISATVRQEIARIRRVANAAKDAGREVAQCLQGAARATRNGVKGIKGIAGILGYFDLIKLGIENAMNGTEPTWHEIGEAYLGYPVDLSPGTPGEV